jgi:hypothetical protein
MGEITNTAPATVGMTDEEIDAFLEQAQSDDSPDSSSAVSAEYVRSLDLILIKIDNGSRLTIPREQMQGLEDATPEQLEHIEIFGGDDISWPDLDVDHYLPHLMEGKYSTERWKQARRQQQTVAA